MIAKTLHALEEVLAKELEALGASDIEIGKRMVAFTGNKSLLYEANLRLRTALRILKPIYSFKASNPDELYEQLSKFAWHEVMSCNQTFSIDTVVYSDSFTHSKYVGYRAKDAIVDYFRAREGKRPSVRLDNPDIYFNIHISHQEVTLSLDSSGESLHKRGYRAVQTEAPINEVLAAGILLMAGWDGSTDFIDPMCGSGTFLIEAALIARGISPGIYRKGFAFERWSDFDPELFSRLYEDDSHEREFEHKIYGSDMLREAIRISERNVARAGCARNIELEVLPLQQRTQPEAPALIVMNPPYGERLKLNDGSELYSMIGERLKHNFSGCTAYIIAYKPEHFDHIGLRPSFKAKLMNGSLECELRGYELFSGKRDDYKSRPREPRFPKREGHSNDRPRRAEGRHAPRGTHREDDRRKPRFDGGRDRGQRTSRPFDGERKPRTQIGEGKPYERNNARGTDMPRSDRREKPNKLWPSDRFRYIDEEGRERRRGHKRGGFQVFRADDLSDD